MLCMAVELYGFSFFASGFLLHSMFCNREQQAKFCALSFFTGYDDMPTMLMYDAMHHGQPHARTLANFLGGIERFEYMLQVLFIDSLTSIT